MLFIENKEELKKLKLKFFYNNLEFIRKNMPSAIQEYILNFQNNIPTPIIDIDNIKLETENLTTAEQRLYYCVLYVCLREINTYWGDFFCHIQSLSTQHPVNFSNSFNFSNTTSQQSALYTIRQCRTDKPLYTNSTNINVGFYNKNENFLYHCYNDQEARNYITDNCSTEALAAYNNIQTHQAKSDFFLIASLYTNGGISADVCSVAQSNIEILIKDTEFLLIFDENGIHKKFIFAQPLNLFILYHLNYLIHKMSSFGNDNDYNNFSDRNVFHRNFLDFYSFYYHDIKNIHITFLHNDIYTAFITDEIKEEELSSTTTFPFIVAKGAFQQQKLLSHNNFNTHNSIQNFYMPPSQNVTIIGHDNNPHFKKGTQTAYTVPSLNVWGVNDVTLAGLGWLWKDNQYISLESHLSDLPFDPNWRKHFKTPTSDNITRIIEDECIVAFSAGYPCYGHYLVDDIPRIGLIKDYLGEDFYNKKFIISAFTPQWAKDMLKFFLGINDTHFLTIHDAEERWKLKKVFISSFPTQGNYHFHNYIREFYKQFYKTDIKPYRKICLSRSLCNPNAKHQRMYQSREIFEYLATSYGFEVFSPETLSIEEQIQLMSETVCQVGEHGSAQHSSVFNPSGMVVGTINPIGDVQLALGRIYNDHNILCYSDYFEWGGHNNEVLYYDIQHDKIIQFFESVLQALETRIHI